VTGLARSLDGYAYAGNIVTVKKLLVIAIVALVAAPSAPSAPLATISRYVSNVDPSRWYDLGCALGDAVAHGTRPYDAGVILDFGDPAFDGSSYGTRVFDGSFRTTAELRHVAEQYGAGYWTCSPMDSTLRIVMATTNHGTHVSFGAGAAWANMVDATNTYYAANCCIAAQVAAIGGIDSELDWNTYAVTKPWVDGYDSANSWLYLNIGDAAGCPPAGTCDNGWTYDRLWYVSWGVGPALPMPQIYNEVGTQARQWQRLDLWAANVKGAAMVHRGSIAQHQACVDRGDPCPGVDNTAGKAWTQLSSALNGAASTAQTLRWSTDISWRN
jgi:hypothetical protein